ncbi:MAG: hypothetical protein WAM39_31550 [Bryobacteraceae bacterium]
MPQPTVSKHLRALREAKGRREVDAHSRQRTAPLAGESLAGAYRPGASARVGAL